MTTIHPPDILSEPFTSLRRDILDIRCLCCGAKLADPTSAVLKLGPHCRQRLGIKTRFLKSNTEATDLIVRAAVAASQHDLPTVLDLVSQLRALDPVFDALADRVYARFFDLRVIRDGEDFVVVTPYDPTLIARLKPLRLYFSKLPPTKGWRVPAEKLDEVIDVIAAVFPRASLLNHDGSVISFGAGVRA